MPAGPIQNPLQQRPPDLLVGSAQPRQQGFRFGLGEIRQVNALADVEWRGPRVLNQIRGSGHTDQAEGQAPQFMIFRAAIVKFANRRKKFIRYKWHAARGVYFVHENHDAFAQACKHNVAQGVRPLLQR